MQCAFYATSNAEQQKANEKYSDKEVEGKQCLAEVVEVKQKVKTNMLQKGFIRSSNQLTTYHKR